MSTQTLLDCGAMKTIKIRSVSGQGPGFTLTLFGCPILWSSKLQTDQTLSSTAAEHVAFSMAMREVLPMRALLEEISSKIELKCSPTTLVKSTIFEDNQGCLSLVNVPKMNTRNKYLVLKYQFFQNSSDSVQGGNCG